MLAITVNILWIPPIVVLSAIFGYLLRKGKLVKSQRRVLSLENEMLQNHAEILKLQQQLFNLENAGSTSSTRVVPMKDSNNDDSQKNIK